MKSDIEIAQEIKMKPIEEIARQAGILQEEVNPYGKYKAKISLETFDRLSEKPDAKLILVTTMSPTMAGNGKTTVTIGLGQALAKIGKKPLITLREPSLGPVMGRKGGATGGGYSQVLPMEDINLHFNGDLHMVTAAHNLLAAMVDNHIHHGNALAIDLRRIFWRRVLDLNDRALRKVVIGLGEGVNGILREDGFDITASSEVMAILCLAKSWGDLKERLGLIIIGERFSQEMVRASELKAHGAMAVLLREAFLPNLVQTIEGLPAFIHGGPFANIAHGCNSLIATRTALKLADYVVTEAGFGSDLGAEKFFNIKCRLGGLTPQAVVLVVSTAAVAHNSGLKTGELPADEKILAEGLANLRQHLGIIRSFGLPVVVALNRRETDTAAQLDFLVQQCAREGVTAKVCDVWARGGDGGRELAEEVVELCDRPPSFRLLYNDELPLREKIDTVAKKIYGAAGVKYTPEAERDLEEAEQDGFGDLPVCIAKTQFSLSDDAARIGCPKDHQLRVSGIKIAAGAGFVVVFTGHILTMPGLPAQPAAEKLDLDNNGRIKGLF